MLNDDQFIKLIETISRKQDERDLLISLNAKLETYQTIMQNTLTQHTKEITSNEKSSARAHKRIDTVLVAGILTVILTIAGAYFASVG